MWTLEPLEYLVISPYTIAILLIGKAIQRVSLTAVNTELKCDGALGGGVEIMHPRIVYIHPKDCKDLQVTDHVSNSRVSPPMVFPNEFLTP